MVYLIIPSELPIALGPSGTAIVGLIILVQALLNAYSWRKSTDAAWLKGAVEAMGAELQIYRDKTTRLEGEVKTLILDEEDCRRKLERMTKWYLEAKGEEEDAEKFRRTSMGDA